jgi:hypothetical protein
MKRSLARNRFMDAKKNPSNGFIRVGFEEEAVEVVRRMLPTVRIRDEDVEHSGSNQSTSFLDRRGRCLAGHRH